MDEIEVESQIITSASETKIDISDNIKEHGEEIEKIPSETKDETESHRKSISRIYVSQYMNDTSPYMNDISSDDYVVTYSREDISVLGWSVNIEKNGPQQHDVYFQVDRIERYLYYFDYVLLSRKILLLYNLYNPKKLWLIDLNDKWNDKRFLELKHPVSGDDRFGPDAIGFLPNGDLIQVSLSGRKFYKYCLTDKPKNTDPWKCSQINDIEIPESLYDQNTESLCYICRTKLFIFANDDYFRTFSFQQFDLLTMNLERHYTSVITISRSIPLIMNKNQTLFAIKSAFFDYIHIFSMENGMLILKRKCKGTPFEFIKLKDNSERLITDDRKLVDPYQAYDEINISNDFNINTSVITHLNKKIFIEDGKVCVTNGLDENKLQKLSNKNINRNNIYTLSTFRIIRSMLNEIINKENIEKVTSSERIVIKDEGPCKVVIDTNGSDEASLLVSNKDTSRIGGIPHILSYKLLHNQELVLINMKGINICTSNEDEFRDYFWNNNEWNDIYEKFKKDCDKKYDINFTNKYYKPLIRKILENEFDNSKYSIPWEINEIFDDVINDNLVSPKFGIEMLGIAIKEKRHDYVLRIINKTIESIQDYSENYMTTISLNLPKLCDRYPDFIIKYISYTSIILSPCCNSIRNSKHNSLHSYTNIYIKESNMVNSVFKFISALYNGLIRHLKIEEEIQTVSFIVPFPQICVYKGDDHETEDNHDNKSKIIMVLKKIMMIPKRGDNYWNEFLYKPKSILFCNIDSNHFYNWWNFAAIVDYKWKTFGRVYYYLIWLFYTIFYVCYSLASTLEQKSFPVYYFELFFIISIIFGSIFLIFEIRHLLWDYKIYLNDIWNSFVLGYSQAFFIVLKSNSITDATDPNADMFGWFPTSLLAVYKLLTGDSGSLSSFSYRKYPTMTILLVTFTFFTVIYLMNLFIGLLNLAIGDYNKKEEFLLQKAQIIMEIELFYLLPWQRNNNKEWFPDWIYYDIPVTEIRKLINAIDNEQTVFNYPPFISEKLRELVVLTDDNNKLEKKIDQLKQQMDRIMKYIGIEQDNKKGNGNEEEQESKPTYRKAK
ncbi:hypothetical protein RclHR1_02430001 [Rhizophagus clarus]|uniref:Ion transport domain-containing protein n=1 Tax=Rhizophagus clarus TaxID=94130 RepID=A0A2Z6QXS0_9GLOM|nr:hypothetical protein RclHR1_02430001 [Rhizophagus clarus]